VVRLSTVGLQSGDGVVKDGTVLGGDDLRNSKVTHEGLTTIAHSSRMGWTIMSGTWNHLRKVWGPTPDTLAKIQTSCKSQERLGEAKPPSRHQAKMATR
jgi:hypothetical protein